MRLLLSLHRTSAGPDWLYRLEALPRLSSFPWARAGIPVQHIPANL